MTRRTISSISAIERCANQVAKERRIAAEARKASNDADKHRLKSELLGAGRVRYIHPDCGFWMLKRSVADAKMRALRLGRDRFEGITS